MIVDSVTHVYHTLLNTYRTREYRVLKDEETGAKVTRVVDTYKPAQPAHSLYDKNGRECVIGVEGGLIDLRV